MPNERSVPSHLTCILGDSLYGAGAAHSAILGVERVNHLFPELFKLQNEIRNGWKWANADQIVFVAAVDTGSDRQGGLLKKAEEAGAIVDPVDYRDYYPSAAPGTATLFAAPGAPKGTSAAEEDAGESPWRPRPTLAPRISFLLGGIAAKQARSAPAQILVIGHHFELKDALLELANRGAKVGVSFYRSLMDPRWERFGLFGTGCAIRFFDLSPHIEQITSAGQRRHSAMTNVAPSAPSKLF